MARISTVPCRVLRPNRAGFTLLELLTALAVLGVAATIFFRLFTSSVSLADSSQSHEIAANLAQEYMAEIQASPERFVWPVYEDAPSGESLPVVPVAGGVIEQKAVEPPIAVPTRRRPYERDRSLYHGFVWEASSRLPAPDAQYVEVTVDITWLDKRGRAERFTLTSAVARSRGEGFGT